LSGFFVVEVGEFVGVKSELEFMGQFLSWWSIEFIVSCGIFSWLEFWF